MVANVLCDFDGTVAVEDVTDGILSRFASSEWQDIERAWRNGEIGSRECMREQVALIRAEQSAIDSYLDTVAIDPYFPEFAAYCQAGDIGLFVVSDGIDYAIRRILARHGLGYLPVSANELHRIGADRYRLTSPCSAEDCSASAGTCKCAIARTVEREGERAGITLLIGDGASDFCAAGTVDLVFAKDRLLAHCRANGLAHVRFTDFKHARGLLAEMVSGPSLLEGTI